MGPKFKCLVGAFLLILLGLTQASGSRTAMVIETQGNNVIQVDKKPAQMRTLQVIPEGASISVPEKSALRLSYFKSGRKEKILGPVTLTVGESASKKTAGNGSIEIQARRNASTKLEKTENLRRMGGELQASIQENPDSMLAKLDPPPADTQQLDPVSGGVPTHIPAPVNPISSLIRTTRGPKPIEVLNLDKAYLSPLELERLEWTGGGTIAKVTISGASSVILEAETTERSLVLDSTLLQAGEKYQLEISSDGEIKTQAFEFLTSSEAKEYESVARQIEDEESLDHRSLYTQLIYLQMTRGLLNLAEKTSVKALGEFPRDSGFLFTLAQIEVALGKDKEAIIHLNEAKKLESAAQKRH